MRKLHVLAAAAALTAGSLFADVQIGKGLSVGGYLDMTFQSKDQDAVAPAPSVDTKGFNIATAEIDFKMDFGGGLSSQVDLEGNVGSDGTAGAIEVEQARIDYAMGQSTLTMGKFDTFVGLEALEAPDLYQYSNSLTWGLESTQHEGLLYSYDNGKFNAAVALVNGFVSNNGNGAGKGEELSYAFHAGFTPMDALSFNLNYAMGNEEGGTVIGGAFGDLTAYTIDASYSNYGWTVGAEYVSVESETNNGVVNHDNETTGYMLMVNYMISEQFGLTGRYSMVEENTGLAGAQDAEASEFTFCASYAVNPNWFLLAEYRTESVDDGAAIGSTAFTNLAGNTGFQGNGAADADIITLETILTF